VLLRPSAPVSAVASVEDVLLSALEQAQRSAGTVGGA
jgi:hypothetical protein